MNRLNSEESLSLANLLCKKLALDLDAEDTSKIELTASLLKEFEIEIIIFSIRSYLGIDRIVRYNLDDIPIMEDIFKEINRSLE
jgi:hypothetical protein